MKHLLCLLTIITAWIALCVAGHVWEWPYLLGVGITAVCVAGFHACMLHFAFGD